jgi:hypothetical protein
VNTRRRSFLLNSSAGMLGFGQLSQRLLAQAAGADVPIARDVVDFWVNHVGVPADMVIQGQTRSASSSRAAFRAPGQGLQASYGREPLVLYIDTEQNRLVPAQEIPAHRLLPPGDAVAELRVGRLRLNSDDENRFEKFSSGGIYLDVQQKQSTAELAGSLAWSVFGALLPRGKAKGAKSSPASAASMPRAAADVQAIALQGGAGKAMFSCFMKDPKRSAFGSFVNTFLELAGKGATEFLPMLGLSAIATPALTAVRALVCNLQAHGGNQEWLFQNSPLDVSCTQDTAENTSGIRLRTGNYIVIPKAHAGALKSSIADVKILDGFLVPRGSGMLDVFDAAPATAEGVSYLSLHVSVKRARLGACSTVLPA